MPLDDPIHSARLHERATAFWLELPDFLGKLDVSLIQAKKKYPEAAGRTRRALRILRDELGPNPQLRELKIATLALCLGSFGAAIEVDQAMETIRNEQERRVRGGRGRAAVRAEHRADVEARAALLIDQNPTWSNAKVCRDMCIWYKLEHGRTASQSAMERALSDFFRSRKAQSVQC